MTPTPALDDLREMLDTLRLHGYAGECYELSAPKAYVDMLRVDLDAVGVPLEEAHPGDSVNLDLSRRGKLTINVH